MRTKILLLSLACLALSCGSNDDSPPNTAGPTGSVFIKEPTTADSYTTLSDTVILYGSRRESITSIDWENLSTGATGTGMVSERSDWCFFFGWYECIHYEWGAAVPLQDGENLIRIYGNGLWADSIIVTRTPSSGISGTVTHGGAGQLNIKLTLVDQADPSSLRTAYTDTAGSYRFSLVTAGTYSLAPVEACYTFDPAYRDVTVADADIPNMDFAVTARPFAVVGGRMTYQSSGGGVWGASVTLTNTNTLAERTAQTNPDGYFTFPCVEDGQYTAAPLPAFLGGTLAATPASAAVTVSGADKMDIDFQASFSY